VHSLETLKQKLLRHWHAKKLHQNYLQDSGLFPYQLKIKKVSSKVLLNNFQQIQKDFKTLSDFSKQKKYPLQYRPLATQKMGEQNIPDYFELTETQYLSWIGKTSHFQSFKKLATSLDKYPKLAPLFYQKPFLLVEHKNQFKQLLTVVGWFIGHPNKCIYMRQISIANIDTKFIEKHKKILSLMLDCCLPKTQIKEQYTGLSHHGFEKRYGLNYEPNRIRFRLLDKSLSIHGLTDLELTQEGFQQLQLKPKNIFITENKINGLTFPMLSQSVVIFGLGYGIKLLANTPWLKNANLYYWGDIDTHGFTILSQLRSVLPNIQSVFMDETTLLQYKNVWVQEDNQQRKTSRLNALTDEENQLYNKLIENHFGKNIRLEQELIPFDEVSVCLNNF
jgi:hypothetical protein